MIDLIATPATWYRGGTSKALFVLRKDLPSTDPAQLYAWIRAAFGSPDRREIDGIGGADLYTSKFAMLGPSTHPQADVDYSFFQVGVETPIIATDANCGNISSAAAPFAIEAGLVHAADGTTTVTIYNTNMDKPIYATLHVRDGKAVTHGDYHIDGVPGTAAPIQLDFRDTVGGRTGCLLPTGHVRDTFEVAGLGEIEASIVDIANLVVFAPASAFGLTGTEDPMDLQSNQELMERTLSLHDAVAIRLGPVSTPEEAAKEVSPFVSLVAPPQDWIDYDTREKRKAESCDFVARGFNRHWVHKAYWGTGSICTGVAAALPGSVVNNVARKKALASGVFRIGHPTGTIVVKIELSQSRGPNSYEVRRGILVRTARKLMDGLVYVSTDRLATPAPLPDTRSVPEWWTFV